MMNVLEETEVATKGKDSVLGIMKHNQDNGKGKDIANTSVVFDSGSGRKATTSTQFAKP